MHGDASRTQETRRVPVVSSPTATVQLPPWAQVSDNRRRHIERVTSLLTTWASAMQLTPAESRSWADAGQWHDALRDAPAADLLSLAGDADLPERALHGPACANRLAREGETREDVLDAIRWHTTGRTGWARTGKALYMADYLEPGRAFQSAERAALAAAVPDEFDGVFRQVVRLRLEWNLRDGLALLPETVALWNSLR
jgi:HD superfamily phosphohydrolase YqeK